MAFVALLDAVVQITLGGIVRVTDSGLGCPDWPLCHGKIIPPVEVSTLIEYSHRLSAVLLGLLSLSTLALALRTYRFSSPVVVSSMVVLVLIVVAAILGGVSVRTELAWWVVLLHLGVAQLVVAFLVVALSISWRSSLPIIPGEQLRGYSWRLTTLTIVTAVGLFALILMGSYMVGLGYGSVCGTWPLCRDSFLPEGTGSAVNMLHRYVAVIVGVFIIAMLVSAWSHRTRLPDMKWASFIVVGLLLVQVLVGALIVWTGFMELIKAIHLSIATLLWASVVWIATFTFSPRYLKVIQEGCRLQTISP